VKFVSANHSAFSCFAAGPHALRAAFTAQLDKTLILMILKLKATGRRERKQI
jgi:hypothetical protein